MLNRLAFASTLSHLRRINSPIGREGKLAKPRQLHNSLWGMMCPAETPEGQAVGLVKNLALMTYITVGVTAAAVLCAVCCAMWAWWSTWHSCRTLEWALLLLLCCSLVCADCRCVYRLPCGAVLYGLSRFCKKSGTVQ